MLNEINIFGYNCELVFGKYINGAISLLAMHAHTPFMVCSVNWEENFIGDNYTGNVKFPKIVIKDYSENKGIVDILLKNGVIDSEGIDMPGAKGYVKICTLTSSWQQECTQQLSLKKIK